MDIRRPKLLEFFAGGGLARLGLAEHFDCVLANDIDPMKCGAYRANFGDSDLHEGDIWTLEPAELPTADLAWASFPCQDLSLAGARAGLQAKRSGAFWGFWRLIEGLEAEGRAPPIIALENVAGLLSSNKGQDFAALMSVLAGAGYRAGAFLFDARLLVPQSRPRLFIVGYKGQPPEELLSPAPCEPFHTRPVVAAYEGLDEAAKAAWAWWRLPTPPARNTTLDALLERSPPASAWQSEAKLNAMLQRMTPAHRARVEDAAARGDFSVGAVYRRIRIEDGQRRQRAEVRYDGLAGCLRTPAGGSSRQFLMVSEAGETKLRLLTGREAARLMGCEDAYILPDRESAALKVMGDGVCVPVVRWIGAHLLSPLAAARPEAKPGTKVDVAA